MREWCEIAALALFLTAPAKKMLAYCGGVWYLLQSTNGFSAVHFGLVNDKPIPNAFVP